MTHVLASRTNIVLDNCRLGLNRAVAGRRGEESPSPNVRTKILQWHERIGLLSLPSLAAALAARWFDPHHHLLPLPHWLPWLRRGLEISLSFIFYFSHYRDGCLQAIRESSPQSSGGPSRLFRLRTHASYTAQFYMRAHPRVVYSSMGIFPPL